MWTLWRIHDRLEDGTGKLPDGTNIIEPLVIRANAGDCIEIRLTNLLPERLEGSPFQMETITDIAGARKYETLIERFFANTELNTVF